MIKLSNVNLGLRKLLTRAGIIVLMAPVAGCGKKIERLTLTETIGFLSETDTESAKDILVDDYIKSICEREETSIEDLEIALETAKILKDKEAMNECIAKLSKIILKSLVAEGLQVPEEELKDFKITGHRTIKSGFDKDTIAGSYGVEFELNGDSYHFLLKPGTVENVAYYNRAGSKGEITFGNSQATCDGAIETMHKALECDLTIDGNGVIKKLSAGSKAKSLTNDVTYDGQIESEQSKVKKLIIASGENAR